MGKIALSQSYSLDGVMQAPGGPDEDRRGGFEHGGWAMDFDFNYGEGVGLEQAQNCERSSTATSSSMAAAASRRH